MYELLSTPERWIKHVAAKNDSGDEVLVEASDAACFCLLGALWRCYLDQEDRYAIQKKLEDNIPAQPKGLDTAAAVWSDAPERTHAEVLALLKELDL